MGLIPCEIETVSSVTERKLHHVPSVSKGKAQGVRRLPVVSKEGVPLAVISIDDVITYGDLNKCHPELEETLRPEVSDRSSQVCGGLTPHEEFQPGESLNID